MNMVFFEKNFFLLKNVLLVFKEFIMFPMLSHDPFQVTDPKILLSSSEVLVPGTMLEVSVMLIKQ